MKLKRALVDEIIAHARAENPNECCGMVASNDGVAVAVHQAENAEASPFRYSFSAKEQLKIVSEIDDAGLELGAIYHSHTRSAAYPSQTDINLAFYPDSLYLIVSLATEPAELRAFTIVGGEVEEVDLEVEP